MMPMTALCGEVVKCMDFSRFKWATEASGAGSSLSRLYRVVDLSSTQFVLDDGVAKGILGDFWKSGVTYTTSGPPVRRTSRRPSLNLIYRAFFNEPAEVEFPRSSENVVTSLYAPSGCGKTYTLLNWAWNHQDERVVMLSLRRPTMLTITVTDAVEDAASLSLMNVVERVYRSSESATDRSRRISDAASSFILGRLLYLETLRIACADAGASFGGRQFLVAQLGPRNGAVMAEFVRAFRWQNIPDLLRDKIHALGADSTLFVDEVNCLFSDYRREYMKLSSDDTTTFVAYPMFHGLFHSDRFCRVVLAGTCMSIQWLQNGLSPLGRTAPNPPKVVSEKSSFVTMSGLAGLKTRLKELLDCSAVDWAALDEFQGQWYRMRGVSCLISFLCPDQAAGSSKQDHLIDACRSCTGLMHTSLCSMVREFVVRDVPSCADEIERTRRSRLRALLVILADYLKTKPDIPTTLTLENGCDLLPAGLGMALTSVDNPVITWEIGERFVATVLEETRRDLLAALKIPPESRYLRLLSDALVPNRPELGSDMEPLFYSMLCRHVKVLRKLRRGANPTFRDVFGSLPDYRLDAGPDAGVGVLNDALPSDAFIPDETYEKFGSPVGGSPRGKWKSPIVPYYEKKGISPHPLVHPDFMWHSTVGRQRSSTALILGAFKTARRVSVASGERIKNRLSSALSLLPCEHLQSAGKRDPSRFFSGRKEPPPFLVDVFPPDVVKQISHLIRLHIEIGRLPTSRRSSSPMMTTNGSPASLYMLRPVLTALGKARSEECFGFSLSDLHPDFKEVLVWVTEKTASLLFGEENSLFVHFMSLLTPDQRKWVLSVRVDLQSLDFADDELRASSYSVRLGLADRELVCVGCVLCSSSAKVESYVRASLSGDDAVIAPFDVTHQCERVDGTILTRWLCGDDSVGPCCDAGGSRMSVVDVEALVDYFLLFVELEMRKHAYVVCCRVNEEVGRRSSEVEDLDAKSDAYFEQKQYDRMGRVRKQAKVKKEAIKHLTDLVKERCGDGSALKIALTSLPGAAGLLWPVERPTPLCSTFRAVFEAQLRAWYGERSGGRMSYCNVTIVPSDGGDVPAHRSALLFSKGELSELVAAASSDDPWVRPQLTARQCRLYLALLYSQSQDVEGDVGDFSDALKLYGRLSGVDVVADRLGEFLRLQIERILDEDVSIVATNADAIRTLPDDRRRVVERLFLGHGMAKETFRLLLNHGNLADNAAAAAAAAATVGTSALE